MDQLQTPVFEIVPYLVDKVDDHLNYTSMVPLGIPSQLHEPTRHQRQDSEQSVEPSPTVIESEGVLHGVLECLDCEKDAYDVVTSLMEMEGELQELLDDTTFLNLPDIFADVVTPPCENVHSNTLVPSVSWEYLRDNEKLNSDKVSESLHPASEPSHQKNYSEKDVLLNHPLLPLLTNILIHGMQDPMNNVSTGVTADSVNFCDVPKADEVMINALVTTNAFFEEKHVKKVMKDIDDECESISSQMSAFCQDLLKTSPQKMSVTCISKQNDFDTVSDEQKENIEATNNVSDQEFKEDASVSSNKLTEQTKTAKTSNKKPKLKSAHKKKRVHIPVHIAQQLRQWLLLHAHYPYPDDDEKDELCLQTGLSHTQLNNWFINARRRILAPMGLHSIVQTSGK